jgi:hypothetical protein
VAYAHEQAGYMDGLRMRFWEEWSSVAKLIEGAWKRFAEMVADEGVATGEEEEEGEDEDVEGAGPLDWLSD